MKKSLVIFVTVLCGISFSVSGQVDKGNKYFDSYNYKRAIECYQKALSKNPGDSAALIHIAACYRILRDYPNAETYYAKAVSVPGIAPSAFYYYGQVLKCTGKIDDAKQQFAKYSILRPADSAAAKEVQYCDRAKKSMYVAYQIATVDNINSPHSEFCPTVYNNELVFISDKQTDIVNLSKNNATGGNFFKIYEAKNSNGKLETATEFPLKINKTESHYNVGPVSFSADGNEIFYTEVAAVRKNNFVNQAKIYYCEKKGSGWGKPIAFPYNSDNYSVMDPSLSADGQSLYFASNMPGGFGGTDIYVCQRNSNGDWLKPQNLGKEINTAGNEAFPYIRKDGELFFASERHFNYGGLDLFSAKKGTSWTDVHNLGPDINSATDDFGIAFNSDNRTGYFSSNRSGGKGLDDIYSFDYIGDFRSLKGSVLLSYNINDPAPGLGISLVNEAGTVITNSETDTKGGFTFTKLDPDKKYVVKVDETDPRFAGKKRFYLADSTGKIVASTIIGDKMGKFVFTALPPDLTSMPKMDATDKSINLAGNLLQGDSAKPLSNVKINLVNSNGDIIQTATTNAFGAFVFTQLAPDENYEFKLADNADSKLAPRTKIVLTDKHGNTLKTFFIGPDGKFSFQVLAADTSALTHMAVDDPQLRLAFNNILLSSDKKTPLGNVKLSAVDKNGNVLQSTVTGPNGDFVFTDLPPDKTYSLTVDANDSKLNKLNKIYIADSKKNILREVALNNGAFKYELLPGDSKTMGNISVYDPWIEALNLKNKKNKSDSMHIIENIYYDYEKWDILPAAAKVLDKVVAVMKADPGLKIELDAFTDPRGSDDLNMKLSQKRADAAVTYMVTHGVSQARVTGKGLGKTHPLNNCGDPNVHCSEAEFAVNRRTEFKLQRTK